MNERPDRRDHSGRGPRKPYNSGRNDGPRRGNDERGPRRDGDYKPRRDGDFKPRREGDFKPRRDGDYKPRRDGDYKPRRDGDFKPRRDGDFKPRRDGDYKPRCDGDYKPRRDGDFKPRRDGDFKPRRDGGQGPRRNDRNDRYDRNDRNDRGPKEYGRGGTRGGGRSDRGGAGREYTEAERLQHQLRPVRSEHADPVLPDEIQAKDLHPSARNELKTLQADVQDRVAKHLAMVAYLIDEDPELAHQHALSASRRAGRIPVARETLAITAYRTGDFALALRELRTYRRLSGRNDHVALMVDCERGLGRPEKAIETAQGIDIASLETQDRVLLAIAVSGARLDLGQTQQALFELEIPELNPKKAFSWSPDLFAAYAAVLEDLGRESEAKRWYARADQAANALNSLNASFDEVEVFEIYEEHHDEQPEALEQPATPESAAAEAPEQEGSADVAAQQHDPDQKPARDAAAAAEPSSQEASDESDAPSGELSVEDEVAQILADAGITDTTNEDAGSEEGTK